MTKMSRQPWIRAELALLAKGVTWEEFHEAFPDRTYDSWEVKRRRIPGASAGRGRRSAKSVPRDVADDLAVAVAEAVERYLQRTGRGT